MKSKAQRNSKQIASYYQDPEMVEKYNARRFASAGGKYVNAAELESFFAFLPKNFQKMKILDLATGTGRVALGLLEMKATAIIAVDPSAEMLDLLQKKAGKRLKYHQAFGQKLGMKSRSLDIVISLRLMEHLHKNELVQVFTELHRVLEPSGSVIFNTVASFSAEALIVKLTGSSSSAVYPLSDHDMESILAISGFCQIKRQRLFLFPRGLFLHAPNSILPFLMGLENLLLKTPLSLWASHVSWSAKSIPQE